MSKADLDDYFTDVALMKHGRTLDFRGPSGIWPCPRRRRGLAPGMSSEEMVHLE